MSETVIFWFSWFWKALASMPDFLGNNRAGTLFACICVIFYEGRGLLASVEFRKASTRNEKWIAFKGFFMNHWGKTLRPWLFIIAAFWVGHTLDLVRTNSDQISGENQRLKEALSNNISSCIAEKTTLLLAGNADHTRVETLSTQNTNQQNTINSCQDQAIKTLGKLIPKTSEEITAFAIGVAKTGYLNPKNGAEFFDNNNGIAILIVISTNQIKERFSGRIKCAKPFVPMEGPTLPMRGVGIITNQQPVKITDSEWEISNVDTISRWGPTTPAFLKVNSKYEGIEPCTFTPAE